MGGHNTTAAEDYRKYQNQLPAQKVGYGVDGEMLAAPAATTNPPKVVEVVQVKETPRPAPRLSPKDMVFSMPSAAGISFPQGLYTRDVKQPDTAGK